MNPAMPDAPQPQTSIKDEIRQKAAELGFDAVGFCRAAGDPAWRRDLEKFLGQGCHGEMDWMARNVATRADPLKLWPAARSVIVLGLNYGSDAPPAAPPEQPERGIISVYARGRDYHKVLKAKLKRLGRWLQDNHGGEVKVFTDTAPVMEKPLAQAAGLGWQGKHTNLVSQLFGSWLFLGEVFTTIEIAPDPRATDLCGNCDACIRACPTGAITAPYELDARRCISYLTIEHKSDIAGDLASQMANRIFGCDDCLAVCPWNKFACPTNEDDFASRPETSDPLLAGLLTLDDAAYRETFAGTPVRRPGRDRFLRNVLIAAGNGKNPALIPAAQRLTGDPAAIVSAAAGKALERLNRTGGNS